MLKHIENKGRSPIYVGGTMIAPGESKHVEVAVAAAPPPVIESDGAGRLLIAELQKLLDQGVNKIVPLLPDLTNEALDLAESQEAAGQNRKTLISAIQAERMDRANKKLQAEQDKQAAEALKAAQDALLLAGVALVNLPPDTPQDERTAAEQAQAEAQARVDALTPAEAGQ